MKILCYDHGLCSEAAIKLAAAGHDVAYFTPWQADFPEMNSVIGRDLDDLERVENFSAALARCDMVACFDTFSLDREQQALAAGKPVFGARESEWLEQDRVKMKKFQESAGIPTGKWQVIVGIDKLIEFLKVNKKKFVKTTGKHRGLVETFFHEDWTSSRSMKLGQLVVDFGPIGSSIEFLIEDPVGDIEPGWDGFFCGGQHLHPFMIGYEDKDETYIGHVTTVIPLGFHKILRELTPELTKNKSSALVSYEARFDKEGKGYLIDPCIRAPHPPLACELEVFDNFADIVIGGALGKAVFPTIPSGVKYSAAIEVKSSWVENHFCELVFPQKNRRFVKLQKACKVGDKYWALPGSFVIATCVGFGSTPTEAATMAKKITSEFKAEGMFYDEASLDTLVAKTSVEGKKYGIQF